MLTDETERENLLSQARVDIPHYPTKKGFQESSLVLLRKSDSEQKLFSFKYLAWISTALKIPTELKESAFVSQRLGKELP